MIINADCLEWLKSQPDNSITTVVTDPPYGIHFMNKSWDKFKNDGTKYGRNVRGVCSNSAAHAAGAYDDNRNDEFESWMYEIAIELLRVTKPGGHLLMFGAPRRYHRQTCALEDAGWEIRDCMMWLYGSGFPKSHNHFGFEGYGTALKPAYEPIIMAMKPLEGTFKQNAEKWGVAGINIDDSRVGLESMKVTRSDGTIISQNNSMAAPNTGRIECEPKVGRWPANILLDSEAAELLDQQSGVSNPKSSRTGKKGGKGFGFFDDEKTSNMNSFWPGDNGGGASRFFYCAKASPSERNAGLEGIEGLECGVGALRDSGRGKVSPNHHPTVKPLKLMEYLIKLVMPPKDGILLDPFAGSGTTILAAQNLGFNAIGIEREKEYCDIAEARLEASDKQMRMAL